MAKGNIACFVLMLIAKNWNPPGSLGGLSSTYFLWNIVAFSGFLGANKVRLSPVLLEECPPSTQ